MGKGRLSHGLEIRHSHCHVPLIEKKRRLKDGLELINALKRAFFRGWGREREGGGKSLLVYFQIYQTS